MDNKKDLSKSIYIGYTPRLILYIVLVPILSVLAVILFYKAFEVDDLLNIRYQELGSINEKILDVNKQETTDKSRPVKAFTTLDFPAFLIPKKAICIRSPLGSSLRVILKT